VSFLNDFVRIWLNMILVILENASKVPFKGDEPRIIKMFDHVNNVFVLASPVSEFFKLLIFLESAFWFKIGTRIRRRMCAVLGDFV